MFSSRLAYLSIWYLYIGIILFVIGWINSLVAVPVCLLLSWGLWRLRSEAHQSYTENNHVTWWGWACLILYSALCVFLCGFDGRVMQSWDFIVRNPLYNHLIEHTWPLQLQNGSYVVYPMGFWLFPAYISQFYSSYSTQILQGWFFLGVLLMALNVWQTLGSQKTLMMLGALFIFAPLTHVADDVLNTIFYVDAYYSVHFRLLSPLTQMFNTYHFYVCGSLALSLLIGRKATAPMIVAITSALAILHPMMAVILFPWILCTYIQRLKQAGTAWVSSFLHPVMAGCIATVTLVGLFYASSTGSECSLVFDAPHAKGYSTEYLLAFISGILLNVLPLLVCWRFCHRRILLYLTGCVPVLMLFWMGQENGISEWWYKFSVLYGFVLLFYLCSAWEKRGVRICLMVLMGLSLVPCMRELKRKELPKAIIASFSPNPDFIFTQYKRMDEINDSLRKQFISPHLKYPTLFRNASSSVVQD